MSEQNEGKRDVQGLRDILAKKHEEKESWFQKKDAVKQEILKSIQEIKDVKRQLDATHSVQSQWKAQRDQYNKKTKELIAQIKPLQGDKPIKGERHPVNISRLQRMMERFETKIETEAMEFEKEKELMVKIKKLKKQLDENLLSLEGRQQYMHLSKEIREAKKKADEYHKKFIEEREKDKESLEKFVTLTKRINDLKKRQEEVMQKCLALKQEHAALMQQTQGIWEEKRKQHKVAAEKHRQARAHQEQLRKEQAKKLLEEKTKSVEEKLKTKKKLTTEDLIVFQGTEKDQ